jgi:hypothetical protein
VPRSLSPIPVGTPITDGKGIVTLFFRLLWQALIDLSLITPTVANTLFANQNAALLTTALYTTTSGGAYRIGYYLEKTIADGVNSSATVTLGWTHNGKAFTQAFAALVLDTTLAFQQDAMDVLADANTNITIALAYASNTPGAMHFDLNGTVQFFA